MKPTPARTGYIPEIQGLRTVALLLVATFHIWIGRISGGVDIFLLVSSFLLTRSLTKVAERGIRPDVVAFITKKFARLLPLAGAAIGLTVIAAWALLSKSEMPRTLQDGIAALFYFENFHLQTQMVDYYAQDQATKSLFQHFWSLSIQGQVFILWPLVHLLCFGIAKATKSSIKTPLRVVFGLIFVASLTWSIIYTGQNQALAYFDTWTRVWEFAAGSLLALAPVLTMPSWTRGLLSLIGLVGVLSCGFVLPVESSFPGWAALWPVVSAALIIMSAGEPTRFGADRLLTLPVLTTIGGYTYALYLVHWPVLILFTATTGVAQPDWLQGTLLLVVSGVISWGLVKCVEQPSARALKSVTTVTPERVRPLRQRVTGPIAVACIGLLLGGGALATADLKRRANDAALQRSIDESNFSELGVNFPDAELSDTPIPEGSLLTDQEIFHGTRCPDFTLNVAGQEVCQELNTDANAPSVFAVGNSHSERLTNVALEAAKANGTAINIRSHALPGCAFAFTDAPEPKSCDALWHNAIDYVKQHKPNIVLVVGTHSEVAPKQETTFEDLPRWIEAVSEASPETAVVVVRDTPRFDFVPYQCATTKGWDDPSCVGKYEAENLDAYAADIRATGAAWVDVNDKICPNGECRPQLGLLISYYDTNHLTAPFMRSLAPEFAAQLRDQVEAWPQPSN